MDLHMRTAPPGRLCSLPPKLRLGLLWLLSRPGGARAAAECSLVRQISSEGGREGHQGGDCVYGVTYGCHGGVVWVATGCQAVVSCAGSGHVRCFSRWSSNVTCPCSATRDTAMQRVRARQSSTWPGAREWTRSCRAPRRDRSGGSRRKMRPPPGWQRPRRTRQRRRPWWWLSAISLAGRREGPTCASRRAPGQARPACWAEGGDRRRAPAAGRACSGDPHARAVRLQAKGPDQAR